jgi:hypothetical protein
MNRKIYASILVVLVCLAFGFLTGCSSNSSPPPPTIVITAMAADATQNATVNMAFASPLGVTVTSNGLPDSGATVTFAATSSGGATCALSATTATTDSTGSVSSVSCTANGTAGSYTVTASVSGATTPATFSLTNTAVQTVTYVFYASGTELPNTANGGHVDYYAVAGAVTFTTSGTFVGGEQDYNDGGGITAVDAMTSASLSVNQNTSQGMLTVVTADTKVGISGTETFAVQFVNQNHALISQFDGSATSSGSLDLQTATSPTATNFAFTLSGIDSGYHPVGYGGVISISSGLEGRVITGTADVNDDGDAVFASSSTAGSNLFGRWPAAADSYGRSTAKLMITSAALPSSPTTLSLAFYVVGGEVVRIIDVDPETSATVLGPAALGSLYGQGTNATSAGNASLVLTTSGCVFEIESNSRANNPYAAAGQFHPSISGYMTSGEGDENGDGATFEASPLVGSTYNIASNGYGSISLTGLGPVASLGLYMTDPKLNLIDPNNISTELAGGLILDMDSALSGGVGVVIPQGTGGFTGSYGFGGQDFNTISTVPAAGSGEFDFVGQAPVASLALTDAPAELSDPMGFFVAHTAGEYPNATVTGTATAPDAFGRYSLPITIAANSTSSDDFRGGMYEVDGNLFFWVSLDSADTFLGTLESQTTGAKESLKGKPAAKTSVNFHKSAAGQVETGK